MFQTRVSSCHLDISRWVTKKFLELNLSKQNSWFHAPPPVGASPSLPSSASCPAAQTKTPGVYLISFSRFPHPVHQQVLRLYPQNTSRMYPFLPTTLTNSEPPTPLIKLLRGGHLTRFSGCTRVLLEPFLHTVASVKFSNHKSDHIAPLLPGLRRLLISQ